MKRKFWKIAALVLAVILIVGLGWFANALNGNPISKMIAQNRAEKYIAQQYPGTDYELERVSYSFKDGNYHAYVVSPSSIDTHFTVTVNMFGQIGWDSYESVTDKFNTAMRLEDEYRDLVDTVLYAADFPYVSDIGYGTMAIYPAEALEYRERNDIPDYAMDQSALVLDGEYDILELGARYGGIYISVDDADVSYARGAEILSDIAARLEEAGIPFFAVDFMLSKPRVEGQPYEDVTLWLLDFPAADIGGADFEQKVREGHERTMAYFEEENLLKLEEEKLLN